MSAELSPDERTELERLRASSAHHRHWARGGRWVGASALLALAALLSGVAVVAVYLRSQVLDTTTYVTTVAPLARDPAVQSAVARRLAAEIVDQTNVEKFATEFADNLVEQGAPSQLPYLVGPLVNGLDNFLYDRIKDLLATQQFEDAWQRINRVAHDGLVTVLTGERTALIQSSGDTVTIDLGELLNLAKQQLSEQGFTLVNNIPSVSIPYTLIQSPELPKLRGYTRLLDVTAAWLPFIGLALLLFGVWAAPNHRRGLLVGTVLVAVVVAILLIALRVARDYYQTTTVQDAETQQAALAIYDTLTRFLVAALWTLFAVALLFVLVSLLAGPSRAAVWLRRQMNRGLDAGAREVNRTGGWAASTGRALARVLPWVLWLVVLAAVVGLIVAHYPSAGAVIGMAAGVVVVLIALELLVHAARLAGGHAAATPHGTPPPVGT